MRQRGKNQIETVDIGGVVRKFFRSDSGRFLDKRAQNVTHPASAGTQKTTLKREEKVWSSLLEI